MKEIWKDVIGYEGWYSVSSLGRIRRDRPSTGAKVGRILKQYKHKGGYYFVGLSKDCIEKNIDVHRIVAKAFIGIPEKNLQVNHKDCNKLNNKISNLEYLTPKENTNHSIRNGLSPFGSNHKNSKINEKDVIKIREIYSRGDITQQRISEKFGLSRSSIGNILKNKTWKHVK